MTDVKRLLDEATPLPWTIGYADVVMSGEEYVATTGWPQGEGSWADATLIVHAVNRLPDYEAAVDLLISNTDALVSWMREGGQDAVAREVVGELNALIARLRDGETADV